MRLDDAPARPLADPVEREAGRTAPVTKGERLDALLAKAAKAYGVARPSGVAHSNGSRIVTWDTIRTDRLGDPFGRRNDCLRPNATLHSLWPRGAMTPPIRGRDTRSDFGAGGANRTDASRQHSLTPDPARDPHGGSDDAKAPADRPPDSKEKAPRSKAAARLVADDAIHRGLQKAGCVYWRRGEASRVRLRNVPKPKVPALDELTAPAGGAVPSGPRRSVPQQGEHLEFFTQLCEAHHEQHALTAATRHIYSRPSSHNQPTSLPVSWLRPSSEASRCTSRGWQVRTTVPPADASDAPGKVAGAEAPGALWGVLRRALREKARRRRAGGGGGGGVRPRERKPDKRLLLRGALHFPTALVERSSAGGGSSVVRVEGGAVRAGTVATDAAGNLFKIEWIDRSPLAPDDPSGPSQGGAGAGPPVTAHGRQVLNFHQLSPAVQDAAAAQIPRPQVVRFLVDECRTLRVAALRPTSSINYIFWADRSTGRFESCLSHETSEVSPACPACSHRPLSADATPAVAAALAAVVASVERQSAAPAKPAPPVAAVRELFII